MLARRSALSLKNGCVLRNENGDMRRQLQPKKAILAVCIAAKDVLPTLSARNKDQKLVGRFLKIGYFIGYFTAVPLQMYGKYG